MVERIVVPRLLPHRVFARLLDRGDDARGAVTRLRGWARRGAAFLAGVCAALAQSPVYATPLMVLGFCIFILLLDGATNGPRPRRTGFLVGWLFGFGYFLAGIYWMAFSFFVQAEQFAWMAPFAMTGLPAFLALFHGAAAAVFVAARRTGWRRVAVFVAVFMAVEYARGHVLTGLPWNLPGQALAGTAMGAQTAALYGVYGLSFVTVLAAAAPVALSGSRGLMRGCLISAAVIAAVFAFGAVRLSSGGYGDNERIALRIVQPNIPQRQKIDSDRWEENFSRHVDLSKASAPEGKRLFIVWPENAAPWLADYPDAMAHLRQSLPVGSVLMAGTVRSEKAAAGKERFYNAISAFAIETDGVAILGHYDKHHLVPFGEYLPMSGLLRAVGLAQLAPYEDGFTAGPGPRTLALAGTKLSPLICYEAIFPGAMHPKGERPDWLLTATNDSWFGDSSGPRQHLDQARLRSIETGLPMARSANSGISALIDGQGRYIHKIALYHTGVFDAPLPKAGPRTLYDRAGDLIFWLMVAAALGLTALPRRPG